MQLFLKAKLLPKELAKGVNLTKTLRPYALTRQEKTALVPNIEVKGKHNQCRSSTLRGVRICSHRQGAQSMNRTPAQGTTKAAQATGVYSQTVRQDPLTDPTRSKRGTPGEQPANRNIHVQKQPLQGFCCLSNSSFSAYVLGGGRR